MFERFTEKSIKVVMLAQEEARRLGHNFVGTEMLLLGVIGEGTGIGAKVLKTVGVNLKDARVESEKIIGRGSGYVAVEIPFTPRAKKVLELGWDEAKQMGHNWIGTEHILLGIIREGDGVAVRVLENLGVDCTKVRSQVIRALGEVGAEASIAVESERQKEAKLLKRVDNAVLEHTKLTRNFITYMLRDKAAIDDQDITDMVSKLIDSI